MKVGWVEVGESSRASSCATNKYRSTLCHRLLEYIGFLRFVTDCVLTMIG